MNKNIEDLSKELLQKDLQIIAPNFKKGIISNEEVNQIIAKVALEMNIEKSDALGGIILLMLKGAASNGTPQTLSVDLRDGKTLAKRNVAGIYLAVTGNNYLRRLAESLAIPIGEFAEKFNLQGELAQRINTILKAQTGEILTPKEMAWCSSFSQNIPDLASRSSDRLVKLLAEDYKKRFEHKKKEKNSETQINKKGKKKK